MPTTRGPGQRAGLDRATVVGGRARRPGRRGVTPGLTMRGLARHLGVAPNALYSHVGDKTELVDLVLDDVLGEVTVPDEVSVHRDPLAAVRSIMTASFDVLLEHTGLMPHFLARQAPTASTPCASARSPSTRSGPGRRRGRPTPRRRCGC